MQPVGFEPGTFALDLAAATSRDQKTFILAYLKSSGIERLCTISGPFLLQILSQILPPFLYTPDPLKRSVLRRFFKKITRWLCFKGFRSGWFVFETRFLTYPDNPRTHFWEEDLQMQENICYLLAKNNAQYYTRILKRNPKLIPK